MAIRRIGLICLFQWQLTISQQNNFTNTHWTIEYVVESTCNSMMACNSNTFSRLVLYVIFTALTKEHRKGGDRPLECSISEWQSQTEHKCRNAIGRYLTVVDRFPLGAANCRSICASDEQFKNYLCANHIIGHKSHLIDLSKQRYVFWALVLLINISEFRVWWTDNILFNLLLL